MEFDFLHWSLRVFVVWTFDWCLYNRLYLVVLMKLKLSNTSKNYGFLVNIFLGKYICSVMGVWLVNISRFWLFSLCGNCRFKLYCYCWEDASFHRSHQEWRWFHTIRGYLTIQLYKCMPHRLILCFKSLLALCLGCCWPSRKVYPTTENCFIK